MHQRRITTNRPTVETAISTTKANTAQLTTSNNDDDDNDDSFGNRFDHHHHILANQPPEKPEPEGCPNYPTTSSAFAGQKERCTNLPND
ncbi:hypothetical protein RP20_CCG020678 [Aedes albopictus]|nr:hypothetical protein RP20_CCG020678 [Aedes albopictus]